MTTPYNSIQGRVQVIDYPYALPSKCCVCGSGPEAGRQFIDFKMSLEFYGAVYYCTDCMREISQALGFVTRDDYNGAEDAADFNRKELAKAKLEIERYKSVLANLRFLGLDVPSDVGVPSLAPDSNDVAADSDAAAGKPSDGPNESGSIEGLADVYEPATRSISSKSKSGIGF